MTLPFRCDRMQYKRHTYSAFVTAPDANTAHDRALVHEAAKGLRALRGGMQTHTGMAQIRRKRICLVVSLVLFRAAASSLAPTALIPFAAGAGTHRMWQQQLGHREQHKPQSIAVLSVPYKTMGTFPLVQ